jgi:hypothetical protein
VDCRVWGCNRAGWAVGCYAREEHADADYSVIWSPTGEISERGTAGRPVAITESGDVLFSGEEGSWVRAGDLTVRPIRLPDGYRWPSAVALTRAGDVLANGHPEGGALRPCVVQRGDARLLEVAPDWDRAAGLALHESGVVVGWADRGPATLPIRWDKTGPVVLPGLGGNAGRAWGISACGEITVGSCTDEQGREWPVEWAGGEVRRLCDEWSGPSRATLVVDAETVAGVMTPGDPRGEACLISGGRQYALTARSGVVGVRLTEVVGVAEGGALFVNSMVEDTGRSGGPFRLDPVPVPHPGSGGER